MARPRDNKAHVSKAVEDLLRSVGRLVDSVGAAVKSDAAVRGAAAEVKKNATETGRKIGAKVKAAWARLTKDERAARIEKMHAWRKAKKG
jgi:hypothetical protein